MAEATVKRNPHPDFKSVEASRPAWRNTPLEFRQTPQPSWTFGDGANDKDRVHPPHVTIDPHAANRPPVFNYKLMISSVTPRPIAFVSTRSADGSSTNLAPFSYFSMIGHDPPLMTIGFACPLEEGKAKDTLRNLVETGECVVNIISEGFLEAANSTSTNSPYGASEWDVSGLTPRDDCEVVKCARVGEAILSIEAKLESVREFESRAAPGKKSATLAVVEGVRFWVREDAINQDRNLVDPKVLRPISRMGGITYGRTTEAIELPRPDWTKDIGGEEGHDKLKKRAEKSSS